MGFTIKVLAQQTLKNLEKYKGQIDFATAKTLTGAAFEARKAVQANLPKWLDIRKPFLARSVVVNKATKANVTAEVLMLPRAKLAPFLEEGGQRRPETSRTLVVPNVSNIDPKRITKSKRPAALLARKDTFSGTIRGVAGIWQKLPGQRLKLLYGYEPVTRYESGKIHFKKTVVAVARKYINENLSKNIAAAFMSAKK